MLGNVRDDRYGRLFAALSQVYPVQFQRIGCLNGDVPDAVIVPDGQVSAGEAAAKSGTPALVVVPGGAAAEGSSRSEVRFGESDCLDVCLQGQTMTETGADAFPALLVKPGDEVLAVKEGRPIWLNRRIGMGSCQIVAAPLPALAQNGLLFRHLSGGRFMGLLPLANFLCRLVRDAGWQDSPIQTCFIFDDPSFYLPSYGFLDYRSLAEHAVNHGLFIAVATIPLDTWWVNRAVAATFRSFNPRLSVIIHGNNHTSHEMVAEKRSTVHVENAAQALRRIDRLEFRYGLAGFKIMEAPHGEISYEMMGHLLSLGYEAALCTTELLVHHNPDIVWPSTLGIERADFIGGGLPVISRIRMSANWKNEVILASLLRKPFVIAGHHWDAADDMRILDEIAKTVNQLSCVRWGSPLDIVRNNYKHMQRGNEFSLKLYSRKIRVCVPEGVTSLHIHRPWLQVADESETLLVSQSGAKMFTGHGGAVIGPIAVEAGALLDISSLPNHLLDFRTVKTPRAEGWPVVRKILMEMRDRSSPARYQAMRWIQGARARPPGKKGNY